MKANKSVVANRRPASPLNAGRQFGSASCASSFLSAAVAQLWRSLPGGDVPGRAEHPGAGACGARFGRDLCRE
jgi:hypothetical protein